MSHCRLILVVASAFGLLAGCADVPFIEYGTNPTVSKPVDQVRESGSVKVCSSRDASEAEIHAVASEVCGKYGLQAVLDEVRYLDCRMTASRSSSFRCVDPNMRDEDGAFINPFSPSDVAAWERRTGRKAPPLTGAESRVQEAARQLNGAVHPVALPADPPPADLPPVTVPQPVPAEPGQSVPAQQSVAPVQSQPSQPPVNAGDIQQFTLPVGSWGDHF